MVIIEPWAQRHPFCILREFPQVHVIPAGSVFGQVNRSDRVSGSLIRAKLDLPSPVTHSGPLLRTMAMAAFMFRL